MLLSSFIYASTGKSNLVAITLCVSLCSTGFCSIRRLPIKVLLDRLIIKNPFFQTSIKKALLYIVQYVFLKIKFCFQVCYLTDFVDTKHTLYDRTKLISLYFSKKYHFIKVNSFKLFLLSNQKHPLCDHTFQRAMLAKFLTNSTRFVSFSVIACASFLKIFWELFEVYYGQFAEAKN